MWKRLKMQENPPKWEKIHESCHGIILDFSWLGLARQMSQWEASIGKFSWIICWVRLFFWWKTSGYLIPCQVVGGSDKGGILVRKGQDLKSEQCADRLGSKVCYPNKTTKKEGVTVDGTNPANQLRLVAYPSIYRLLYIPGSFLAGFLNHQHHDLDVFKKHPPTTVERYSKSSWFSGGPLTLTHRSPGLSTGALVLRRVEMGEMGERHVWKLMDLIHVHAFKWEKLRCIMSEMFLIERFLVTCG